MNKNSEIIINSEDLPKHRDLNRVSIIERKKGAHKDHKREDDKKKCREKVSKNDEA